MRRWIRHLLKGVSCTAALFVFQACYGTPIPEPEPFEPEKQEAVPDDGPGQPLEEEVSSEADA